MATSNEDITRGHELYLKHLLLLEQAAPLVLKAFVKREAEKQGGNLANLISAKKEIFNNKHKAHFPQLFRNDEVNTEIDSWDTRLLCVVTFVLFTSCISTTDLEDIKCISEQRNSLDKYSKYVSMTYNAFKESWDPLHTALLRLIENIPDESKFKWTQLVHSFNPDTDSVRTNLEMIEKMKQTSDIKLHVQMAINENVVSEEPEQCEDSNKRAQQNENPVFTEKLKNVYVFCDDPAILTCKLNLNNKEAIWRHECRLVEETDIVIIAKDRQTHCLAIPNAKLKDAGKYSCTCGTASTSAYLTVTEKRLKVVEDLHVATEKANVRENCDVVLICEVNFQTHKVVWLHSGKVIRQCNRTVASVQGLQHTLTIRNAKFEDEGEYSVDFGDVTSSTKLTIHGNLNLLHKMQLEKDLCKNWIRGALGLKYLKLGLEEYADNAVKNHHTEILKQLSSIGQSCTVCTTECLLPSHKKKQCPKRTKCLCSKQPHTRRKCPNGEFCSKFYDHLLWDHRFNDLVLANTDVQNWRKDPWSVATCYISTAGYQGKSSAKGVDCSGLLSLFINNLFFEKSLGDVEINGETDVFKQARDARNDILHSANYDLSESQLLDYINLFVSVLEIKDILGNAPLSGQKCAKDAIANLKELRDKQIEIHISDDLQKQMEDLKEHAMHELAEKIEKAEKQKDIIIQRIKKRLEETETELQLLSGIMSSQTDAKKDNEARKVPFELELHTQVIEKTGETSIEGNRCVYQTMKDYFSNQNTAVDSSSTEQSIHRILRCIFNIETCEIVKVLHTNTSVKLIVNCFTCKAIEEFLKLINGNEFQKELIVLRTCLGAHDVTASCSSQSIENTRSRLGKRLQITNMDCAKHQGAYCTWYCSDHEQFCCSKCKDSDHRACVGIKQVVSGRSYEQQKQSLVFKSKRGKYNVRIKNRLINRRDSDQEDCYIRTIHVLPDGHILVLDFDNSRLKKLDSSYNLVSYCDLPGHPVDMCYIGKDTAIVSSRETIQYVNVSDNMKLLKEVKLQHKCDGLACHGDTLYITDILTVYTYNKDCEDKRVLYRCDALKELPVIGRIAVSDDGERIYLAHVVCGLITIDNVGNHLFTLRNDVLNGPSDVCVVGDGTVLVLNDVGYVLQVDYSGEHILGTVVSPPYSLPVSLSYDRKRCRLIVGGLTNYVSVYDLQSPSDTTDLK